MPRPSVVVVTLVALAASTGVIYSFATRTDSSTNAPMANDNAVAPTTRAIAGKQQQPLVAPGSTAVVSTQPASQETIARWIADTHSTDAKARVAAIAALAEAPQSQAVPILERVLEAGEAQVDRQVAIRSLHILALKDGDADGKVRDVLRHALYHNDNEDVTQSAQAVLEDIEAELALRAASP